MNSVQIDDIEIEAVEEYYPYGAVLARFYRIMTFVLLPLTFVYLEIMLRVMSGDPFAFLPTVGMILFSCGAGFLCTLISSAFHHRTARWIIFAFAEIATIAVLLMYFINNSFRTYMDPVSLIAGTGDVVGGFKSTIKSTILRGFPIILLFHIPSFIVLILNLFRLTVISCRIKWQSIVSAALAVVFIASSPFIMTADRRYKEQYTSEFSFDPAVRSFGLGSALGLNTLYSIFGNPFDSFGFDIPPEPAPDEQAQIIPAESDDTHVLPDPDDPSVPAEVLSDDPSEAEEPVEIIPEPEPIVYADNIIEIDYNALADTAKNKDIADLYRYVASLTPSKQNEYTGLFEGKNLILITAEAFSKEVIDAERTPALYRMATKGINFEDYYQPAWGGSTSTGEFSIITGILPVNKVASVRQTIGHNMYLTLGSQLMRLGYESGAYHNGSYTYYGRNETHMNFGYSKFIGMGNGMEKGVRGCWPESDDEMFRFIMPEFIESGKPFSLYFMTVSGHCAYSRAGNSMSVKNYDYFKDMDASETIKCYHAANYELELAMEYLISALEDAGIADDTVIVIGADHYPYGLEDSAAWGTDRDYLKELYGYPANSVTARDHSALIIWSGCLEDLDEPIVVSDPVYSLDIVPTLSNLFGVEYDSRLLAGRDVFSDAEPLVLWQNYSWKTDKGFYDSPSGVFTPAEGTEIEDGYVERIRSVVRNKFTFAKGILAYDLYGLIFNK